MRRSSAITASAAVLILIFAASIRIIGLENNPPGFWQDEASTGVDAYLLWRTGRDRAGVRFPIIARSFGDYPLALYRYLDAPIVGLLGPSPAKERIVAAVAGTLAIGATGALVARLFGLTAALLAMISGALSPTWIHFSRYGSEAILLPFFLILGWALIEHGKAPGRRGLLWAGAVSLGLSAYTYHAVKVILPLWVLGFLIAQRGFIKELWREQKAHLIGPAVLFAAMVAPSAYMAFTDGGMARGRTMLAWYHASGFVLFPTIAGNYLSYFDPGMLFVRGGPAVAQSMPGLGLWSLMDLPLMIAGGLWLIDRAPGPARSAGGFLLWWFLLGPVPGGLTFETQNVGRAIAWIPVPQILSGIGAMSILERATERSSRVSLVVKLGLAAGWIITAVIVTKVTLFEYPKITQRDWQYEISGAMRCALEKRREREQIIVSPAFQVAEVFGTFFFDAIDRRDPATRPWSLGDPPVVEKGTLYVFPAPLPVPVGKEVCRITRRGSANPVSYVYAAAD